MKEKTEVFQTTNLDKTLILLVLLSIRFEKRVREILINKKNYTAALLLSIVFCKG